MVVVDQFTDKQHRYLVAIVKERPDIVGLVKTASVSDGDSLPGTAFAYADARRFPVHTPEHAVLSKMYAEKQAAEVPPKVMERIDNALTLYGYAPEQISLSTLEKTAQETTEDTEDSSCYLLPQYRRLRVKTASDVKKTAAILLNHSKNLTTATVAQAATRLVKKAAEHNLYENDLPTDIYKYAGLTGCHVPTLVEWVEARAVKAPSLETRFMFDKIAAHLAGAYKSNETVRDRPTLIKIAGLIEQADQEAGLERYYGTQLLDPLQSVFNTDKVAEKSVELGSTSVSASALLRVPLDAYERVLGEGFMDHVKAEDGEVDRGALLQVLETLPADMKTLLLKQIQPYF